MRVNVVGGLAIKLFSLHALQAKHAVTLGPTGVHILGGNHNSPRGTKGLSLRAAMWLETSQSMLSPVTQP